MGVVFLQPWVWLLAVSVGLPVVIHLLARDRSRRVVFPTVRFLESTRLSAATRRTLRDWPLLLVRVAIVLVSVAALAGPVFVTPARQAAWTARVARAIVLDDRAAPPEDELRSAAPGATFARARVQDAVLDGLRWLSAQRPSRHEIVVLSQFKRGAVDAADFVDVPDGTGIRLVRTSDANGTRQREISRLQLRDEGVVRVGERLAFGRTTTEAREGEVVPLDRELVRVVAPPDQQGEADAALRAVLRRGLRLPPAGLLEPIQVEWPGDVARLAAAIEARMAAPLDAWEPDVMSDAELAALARPARSNGDARPEDEGDRRTWWAALLVLMAVEVWMRRGPAWTS